MLSRISQTSWPDRQARKHRFTMPDNSQSMQAKGRMQTPSKKGMETISAGKAVLKGQESY